MALAPECGLTFPPAEMYVLKECTCIYANPYLTHGLGVSMGIVIVMQLMGRNFWTLGSQKRNDQIAGVRELHKPHIHNPILRRN